MKVISADGVDVQPVHMDRFLIAIAEIYDVIITVPENGAYELRATAQDGSGHTSLHIGKGNRVAAPEIPKPNIYKMQSSGHDKPGGNMKDIDQGSGGNMQNMGHAPGTITMCVS